MNNNIPPIFVISLKRAEDRRVHIKKELDKFGLEFEFFDAVVGESLDDEAIKKVYSKEKAIAKYRPLVKGEIGCAMSHISLWQKMLDENIDEAIVFEDDAVVLDNFIEVAQNIQNATPKKWQLILFDYNSYKQSKKFCQVSTSKHNKSLNFKLKKPLVNAYLTHAYLINKSGAAQLIQQILPLYQQLDVYTGDYKIVDVYCVNPPCAGVSEDINSVIDMERRAGATKNYGLEKPITFYSRIRIFKKYRFIAIILDIKDAVYYGSINIINDCINSRISCVMRILVYKFHQLFKK